MNGEYDNQLNDCTIELDKIETWINNNKLHSNVRYLVSYSVVKASGTIEMVLKQMLFDYLTSNANSEAINYFTKYILEASFNPSTGQIIKLLSSINPAWKEMFETIVKGKTEKGQLNSLVDLRNSFAHGNAITASIENIKVYFQSGKWVLEQLHSILFVPQ